MTHEELRNIYGLLKERTENADMPSFAAVKRAKQDGRISIEENFNSGFLVFVRITITGKDAGTWKYRWGDDPHYD